MKKSRFLPVALILILNLGIGFSVYCSEIDADGSAKMLQQLDIFVEVLQLLRKNYVDEKQVSADELITGAIKGMVRGLDPYSAFLVPEEMNFLKEETEGEFGGIGISLGTEGDDYLTVISTVDDSPAAKAGILAGDRIVGVDTFTLNKDSSLDRAVHLLRGPAGSKVELSILRDGVGEVLRFELTRAMIPVSSVVSMRVLPETSIGYLRITQFMEPTAAALEKALREFDAQKVNGLIIDLRGNPGGLLDSVARCSSFFLPAKKTIVSVIGRDTSFDYDVKTIAGYKFPKNCPLIILINPGSASASEIMAGCLKDLHRAVLIGERSFGKGSVQNVHELPAGYALKMTVAKYYTPSKSVIHEVGILPDIEVKISQEDFYKLINSPEDEQYENDIQLQKAVEVLQTEGSYEYIRSGQMAIDELNEEFLRSGEMMEDDPKKDERKKAL